MDQPIDEILLIRAVRDGSINNVKTLLSKDVKVNYIDSDGKSALYYAVENRNSLNVEMLLKKGADVYLEISTNEILADCAMDILSSGMTKMNPNEKKIVQLFKEKIFEDSVRILKECEELEQSDERSEKAEITSDMAEVAVMQKIDELLSRLEDRNFSDYKAANTFLLFLESFTFDDDLTDKYVKDLKRKFLNEDHTTYSSIKKLRSILLKSSSKIRTPEIIFEIIRFCFVSENENVAIDKKIQFFDKLKEFLKSFNNDKNPIEPVKNYNINTFFKFQDEKQIKAIIDRGQTDNPINKIVYEKFINFVLKAYKNEIDEDEHWFEFNINIFPCLAIVNKEDKNERLLEKQMLHLRHNFVHSFTRHGPEVFKKLIVNLRGMLFEYYYVRKLHARLITSITCKVEEIEDEINKDFESIRDEFKYDNRLYLSEEESKNVFASKFKKSLFPTLVSNDEVDQSLVEDYFTFIPVIEYMNKNVKNRSSDYSSNFGNINEGEEDSSSINVNHCLKLDDFSRRRFLEQYVMAKGYKERNDEENYFREKKRLIDDLTGFGIERECIENIFKYHLEEGRKFSDTVSTIVKNVGQFMKYLISIKTRFIQQSKIISIVESFLKDRTDLVIHTHHSELPKDIQEYPDIEKLVKTFTIIKINDIEVDVKATIKMMVKTFYEIFNEYGIEFNVRDLFNRETFLDALLNEEEKLLKEYKKIGANRLRMYVLISIKLVQIDYMSPFIAKQVKYFENEDDGFIKTLVDESMMKKLIENLIKMESLNYLSILLTVKFDKYNPYQLLHDFVVEKEHNLELIRQIFDNFDHIKGFTKILTASCKYALSDEYIKKTIIPFLEIINENAADRLYYIINYSSSRFKILINKRLYDNLAGVTGPDPVFENLSKIVEKTQENREKENKAAIDVLLESDKIESKFFHKITACNVHFINRDLLKAKISCVQENYEDSLKILESVIERLDSCKNDEHSDVHDSYKLLTSVIYATCIRYLHMYTKSHEDKRQTKISPIFNPLYTEILKHVMREDYEETEVENVWETYEKIKDNDNYKKLLSVSELLCSETYLDILNVATEVAYEILRMQQLEWEDKIESQLQKALKIYESIYSCYYEQYGLKSIKTIEYLKYIGITYLDLSLIPKTTFYCLKALVRFNMYYDIRKEIPVGFVRNYVKRNIIYALHNYIFKMLTDSKDSYRNREDILKKVYELCKKILDRNEKSSTAEKLSRHYVKILFSIAYISKERGEYYLPRDISRSIDFYNESLKYFEEITNVQDVANEQKNKCFTQMAKINNKLFNVLIKNFDNKSAEKMKKAAEYLRASIYFNEKLDHNYYSIYNKLKLQLKHHCKANHLNFDKIMKQF